MQRTHVRQISKPIPFDLPQRRKSPVSPPRTPPDGHHVSSGSHSPRPSITNPMAWLSRASTSNHNHAPQKPVVSEPVLLNAFEEPNTRYGALGTGATVVRTPQEALQGTTVHLTPEGTVEQSPGLDTHRSVDRQVPNGIYPDSELGAELPSPPHSPRTPPPPPPKWNTIPSSKSSPDLRTSRISFSEVPPVPRMDRASPRSSTSAPQQRPDSALPSDQFPSLPALASPMQRVFAPILISQFPPPSVDRASLIVSLETATTTYRTTFMTLSSRPSHLASYLTALLAKTTDGSSSEDDAASVHTEGSSTSVDSPFRTIFNKHVGGIPYSLHIFLDRPSPPYVHIMTYLRNPSSSNLILPRAVRLRSHLQVPNTSNIPDATLQRDRLEALLELREEAQYLGLEDLQKLCTDELTSMRLTPPRVAPQPPPQSNLQPYANNTYTYASAYTRTRTSSVGSSSSSLHALPTYMEPLRELPESPPPTTSLSTAHPQQLPPRLPFPSSGTLRPTHSRFPSAPVFSHSLPRSPSFASAAGRVEERPHDEKSYDSRKEVFSTMSARPPPPGWI